jgi:hypothetical protein
MLRIFAALNIIFALLMPFNSVNAQSLDSTNYRLIEPSIGEPVGGIIESSSYKMLVDSSSTDDTVTTSSNYRSDAGTANFIEAAVPKVTCFETSTSSGTCSIGSNGMQEVCAAPGCYDRAKFKIDAQSNPNDVRYAVQMSTTSNFSSNNFYVDSATRLPTLTITTADFLYKCEWEGTTVANYCASPNTTYQKFNVFGLSSNTTYYIRFSAYQGIGTDAQFTQSEWGPSASATTSIPSLTLDLNIAPDTVTNTNVPYLLNFGSAPAGVVTTAANYIVLNVGTNAVSGLTTSVKGLNGQLQSGSNNIPAVNTDLDTLSVTSGWGIRNESTTNSQQYATYLGSVTISNSPNDFTDAGAANKVGAPSSSFVTLFTSNLMPLHTGKAGFESKIKPIGGTPSGNYNETVTFVVVADFD